MRPISIVSLAAVAVGISAVACQSETWDGQIRDAITARGNGPQAGGGPGTGGAAGFAQPGGSGGGGGFGEVGGSGGSGGSGSPGGSGGGGDSGSVGGTGGGGIGGFGGFGGTGGQPACFGFDGSGGFAGGIGAGMVGSGSCASAQEIIVPRAVITYDFSFFPVTPVGGRSAPKQFTLKNVGCAPITSLHFTLTDTSDYKIASTTCASMLAADAFCTVDIVFTPTRASCKIEAAIVARMENVPVAAANLEGASQ
jgi:hypothetical protein